MALFPESPVPTWSYILESEFKTLITPFDSGKEQRRQKWTYDKYNVVLSYYGQPSSASETIWAFYRARKGAYEAFHFFDPLDPSSHTALYVGAGDSTTVNFSLPGKQTSNHSIYLNNVATTAYTVSTGAGEDGSDRITMTSAPSTSQVITCSFLGKLRVRCRFEEDKLSRDNFDKNLFSYGIRLKGLAPA
jgi:uncharacterized protein (TIGR02217 family)